MELYGLDGSQVDNLEFLCLGVTEGVFFCELLDTLGGLQGRKLIVGREVLGGGGAMCVRVMWSASRHEHLIV